MIVVELVEEAADWVETVAWHISKHSETGTLHSVAVAVDEAGVRFQINGEDWTPAHGDVVEREISREEETNWNEWR